jgi:NADP-reducing hydrogenase subunit HndB
MSKKFKSINDFKNYKPVKNDYPVKILVGMGSCGIAAGADKVFTLLENEIKENNLTNIKLQRVGCLGQCYSEPNVEVIMEGLPDVLYGKVDEKFALRILQEHIGDKKIINHNIYDKPYIDVYQL